MHNFIQILQKMKTRVSNVFKLVKLTLPFYLVSFRGIGPLRKGVMESTTLDDLELRVGYPYLYTHQVHEGLGS